LNAGSAHLALVVLVLTLIQLGYIQLVLVLQAILQVVVVVVLRLVETRCRWLRWLAEQVWLGCKSGLNAGTAKHMAVVLVVAESVARC
jgi:hypothetical protein